MTYGKKFQKLYQNKQNKKTKFLEKQQRSTKKMFNDQILNMEYIRYLKNEKKHCQENLDKCLKYMRLNENNNNTLGFVYSTIFLENAKSIKEIEKQIQNLEQKDKERTDKQNG